MKVVKGPEVWKTEVECRSCKATLEIGKEDLRVVNTAMSYAGETWDPVIRVTCCVCETSITVDKVIPYDMRSRLIRKAVDRRRV